MTPRRGAAAPRPRKPVLDVEAVRGDFPILSRPMRGKPLVYLDNANSTQKPRVVVEALRRFYEEQYSNIHRGVYLLSQEASELYEKGRERVARFLNAREPREIVFVRGTTEAINLVARSFGRPRLTPGDEILLSGMEHHSGIVPWQMVCEEAGARLRVIPVTDSGELDLGAAEKLFGPKTRMLSLIHVSNALGTVNPVEELIAMARRHGVPVLLDGAQAVLHGPVDVQALDCDFYAFSGHKLFGPTGIGVLYGKAEHLDGMPPYQGGGNMIHTVTFERTTYAPAPFKFEAGTTNIAGTLGLAAALDYLESLSWDAIRDHERALLAKTLERLAEIPEVRVLGSPKHRVGVLSIVVDGVHPHDVGTVLDLEGVCVRAGHHCAQPLMNRFSVPATVRASFAMYNTFDEVDALAAALGKAVEVFRG